jgi:chromosomal replication initiation ATPase DnaA
MGMSEILVRICLSKQSLDYILKKAQEITGITISKTRKAKVVQVKALYAKIAHMQGYSKVAIGRKLGCDHSSVIHLINEVHERYMTDYNYMTENGRQQPFTNEQYQNFFNELKYLFNL